MGKSNILIRKVKVEDAEQYVKLINYVWSVAYKHIFPKEVFYEMQINTEQRIKKFPENFYNDNTKMCYVAEDKGTIIGLVYGTIKSTYDYFAKKDFADLVSLYVKPEYQNKGIGNMLKETFLMWAKENGAEKYVIGVLKENTNARKIYEKWGGILDSYEHSLEKLGVGYDEVFYTYKL